MRYNKIDSLDKLCDIFEQQKTVNFYGAGVRLYLFFQTMDECGLDVKADRIIVSSAKGNPEKIRGIPVVEFTQSLLTDKDIVLLTLSECYIDEVENMLKSTKAEIYRIDFDIIDAIPSDDVLRCIAPFINIFSMNDAKWNVPDGRYSKSAWSMWWQGEENAPDIVKACWKSQRLNLPEGVELRIITEGNFREYIDIPDYILDKYEKNLIAGAHLSDIIRCCLLYKYGGIWMDATLLLCAPIPEECLEYPIYTRTTYGREFNSKAVWAIWFLCSQSGEKLFKFVMQAYFYYFQHHDRIKYYLTTDYLIGIACNTFPEICERLNRIPYNNINAMVLGKHLTETYSETDYNKYIEGTFIQKLTWHGNAYAEDSVYRHIINTYGGRKLMDFDQAVEEIFELAHNMKEIRIIKERISAGKEIVIFGAGNCGHAVWRFLSDQGIKIEAFCDNRLSGSVDEETSLPIIGVGQMEKDRKRYFILVSVADKPIYEMIYHQLMQAGFQDSQCLFMKDYVETIPIGFLTKYRNQYRKVFDMLEDGFSRKVYIERIKRVYTLSDLSDVMQPEQDQYFDKIVKLTENEVFIDCGAYIGDTAAEFIKRTNGKYRQIYMFEAEKSKYSQIRSNMKGFKYLLYPFGVWSENTRLRFDAGGGSASKVLAADTQGAEIEAVALDGIEFDESPTFIKMDIEGSEKQALLGASDLILKYTPKLAICVYHKPEDLFELPLLIKEINPKYSLYMRHYSDHFAETVCYAI